MKCLLFSICIFLAMFTSICAHPMGADGFEVFEINSNGSDEREFRVEQVEVDYEAGSE